MGYEFDNFRLISWTERGILKRMFHIEPKVDADVGGAVRKIRFLLSSAVLCTAATFSAVSVAAELDANIPAMTPKEVLISLRQGPSLPDQVVPGYWDRLNAALNSIDRLPDSDGSDEFPTFL